MKAQQLVGVIGATSFVGTLLVEHLKKASFRVESYSRKTGGASAPYAEDIALWVCIAPIWILPEYFSVLQTRGARRIVTLSSTSLFTKEESTDPEEQNIVLKYATAEEKLKVWAESHGIEWIILRPTLIYGLGRDKNIAEIARVIRRFGFFPIFGEAKGLRQPVHADDVAQACYSALVSKEGTNQAYNISGGETLSYRDMVTQIFSAMKRPARMPRIPLWAFHVAVTFVRLMPRYSHWSAEMASRMNRDLVFDHSAASQRLGYNPRRFQLSENDV